MPFEGPDGQKFSDFMDCVTKIQSGDTSREDAQKICGRWQSDTKED